MGVRRSLGVRSIQPIRGFLMSQNTTSKTHRISAASLFLTAAASIVFAGSAHAGTAAELTHFDRTVVEYGDLNLGSQLGTKVLYARLRNGAEDVCSSFEGRDLFFKRVWQACFEHAVAAAVLEVNSPGLTTLHNQTINRSKKSAGR
jgi:UrcA family protein